jgi:hypothetical protein
MTLGCSIRQDEEVLESLWEAHAGDIEACINAALIVWNEAPPGPPAPTKRRSPVAHGMIILSSVVLFGSRAWSTFLSQRVTSDSMVTLLAYKRKSIASTNSLSKFYILIHLA